MRRAWRLLIKIERVREVNFNVNNPRVPRGYIHFVLRGRISKSTNHINTQTIYVHLHEQSSDTNKNFKRTIIKSFRVPRHHPRNGKELLWKSDFISVGSIFSKTFPKIVKIQFFHRIFIKNFQNHPENFATIWKFGPKSWKITHFLILFENRPK